MKGQIEKIWDNESRNGQRYLGLAIDGQRYTLWEEQYFDQLQEGDVIDFEWNKSGRFKNITKIAYANNGSKYQEKKLQSIIRMSCLKSASELISGSDVEPGNMAEMAIDFAKKFEDYIKDDFIEDNDIKPKKKSR